MTSAAEEPTNTFASDDSKDVDIDQPYPSNSWGRFNLSSSDWVSVLIAKL